MLFANLNSQQRFDLCRKEACSKPTSHKGKFGNIYIHVTRKTRRELESKRNILVFSGSQARSSNYVALVTFLSKVNLARLEHTDLFVLLEIWSSSLRHGGKITSHRNQTLGHPEHEEWTYLKRLD
jgi:hypothetical protein